MDFQRILQSIKSIKHGGYDYHVGNFFSHLENDKVLSAFYTLSLAQKHELLYVLLSEQLNSEDAIFCDILNTLVKTFGNDYFAEIAAIKHVPKNRMDLLKKLPHGSGIVYSIDDTFMSAIDHVIAKAPLPHFMQDPNTEIDLNPSIELIKILIDFKIDVRNICGRIDCPDNPPGKQILLKTTLHFAMDVGFDQAVYLLIDAQAHRDLHPLAPSAVEYAQWLDRPDYIDYLRQVDLEYVRSINKKEEAIMTEPLNQAFALDNDVESDIEVISELGNAAGPVLTSPRSLQFSDPRPTRPMPLTPPPTLNTEYNAEPGAPRARQKPRKISRMQ